MKPLLLEIEGINSFRQKQVIDFRALSSGNLFCISGKTGSGKTTVLDCVILGLYQKLPSFSSRGNIDDYINLSCEKGEIKLTFELDGKVYRTERVISRKGANSAKIVDVETGAVIKEKNNEAFAFIGEKLGLSVDDFARVIVLQQGEFAQFLRANKSDRNATVIKLFRLDRFSDVPQRFRAAANALKIELEKKDAVLAGYDNDTAEREKQISDEIKLCDAAVKKITAEYKSACEMLLKAEENMRTRERYEKAVKDKAALAEKEKELLLREKRVAELEEKIGREQPEIKKEQVRKEEYLRLSAKLENERVQLTDLIERKKRLDEKRAEYSKLNQKYAEKKKELELIDRSVAETETLLGDYAGQRADVLSAKYKESEYNLKNRRQAKGQLTALKSELYEVEKRLEGTAKHALAADENMRKADENLSLARKNLDDVRLIEGANSLKKQLHAGDVCPVCGEILKQQPVVTCSRLKEAEERALACENDAATARKEQSAAAAALAADKSAREQLFANFSACEKQYALLPDADEKQTETLKKALSLAVGLEKTRTERQKIASEEGNMSATLSALVEQGKEDKIDYENRLNKLTYRDFDALSEQEDLVGRCLAAINARIEEYERCVGDAAKLRLSLDKEKAENKAALEAAEKLLVKAPDPDIPDPETYRVLSGRKDEEKTAAVSERAKLENTLTELKSRLEVKRALRAERAEINKKYEKINCLAAMFSRGEFNAFVATEYIKDFTVSASETLRELTGGKYTLSYDEQESDFFVTDFLNDNKKRKARTLSGGETFLASLSMAIALSKEIARFGTFDFFFIDEGFGTLHDAALDQALEVLFELSKTSLVGLVTHRTELIGRIPVTLLVSEADGEAGSVCRIAD